MTTSTIVPLYLLQASCPVESRLKPILLESVSIETVEAKINASDFPSARNKVITEQIGSEE